MLLSSARRFVYRKSIPNSKFSTSYIKPNSSFFTCFIVGCVGTALYCYKKDWEERTVNRSLILCLSDTGETRQENQLIEEGSSISSEVDEEKRVSNEESDHQEHCHDKNSSYHEDHRDTSNEHHEHHSTTHTEGKCCHAKQETHEQVHTTNEKSHSATQSEVKYRDNTEYDVDSTPCSDKRNHIVSGHSTEEKCCHTKPDNHENLATPSDEEQVNSTNEHHSTAPTEAKCCKKTQGEDLHSTIIQSEENVKKHFENFSEQLSLTNLSISALQTELLEELNKLRHESIPQVKEIVDEKIKGLFDNFELYKLEVQERIEKIEPLLLELKVRAAEEKTVEISNTARELLAEVIETNLNLREEISKIKEEYSAKIVENGEDYEKLLTLLKNQYLEELGKMENVYQETLDDLQTELRDQYEKVLRHFGKHYQSLFLKSFTQLEDDIKDRLNASKNLVSQLTQFNTDVKAIIEYKEITSNNAKLSWAYLTLEKVCSSSSPLQDDLFDKIKEATNEDPFIKEIISTIPKELIHGIPTKLQLDSKLEHLISSIHETPVRGNLGGRLFSSLYSIISGIDDQNENQVDQVLQEVELIKGAQYHLRRGSIPSALKEIQKVRSPDLTPVLEQWKQDAMARHSLDEMLELYSTHLRDRLIHQEGLF